MSQDRPFIWKSHQKHLGWAHKLSGVGSQGMTRLRQTVIARLMDTQTWLPPAGCVGGGVSKGIMASDSTTGRKLPL